MVGGWTNEKNKLQPIFIVETMSLPMEDTVCGWYKRIYGQHSHNVWYFDARSYSNLSYSNV
tara:strand:+ start:2741 stop:2923 length:183 start_codon:yes stop_codon:yes gene_type:complete